MDRLSWDPQVLSDALPDQERPLFLQEYQHALRRATDLGHFDTLRRTLLQWRLVADMVSDPAYRERLQAARDSAEPGLAQDQVTARWLAAQDTRAASKAVQFHRYASGDWRLSSRRSPDEAVALTADEVAAFITQVKNGDYDHLLDPAGED